MDCSRNQRNNNNSQIGRTAYLRYQCIKTINNRWHLRFKGYNNSKNLKSL